jgi:hypothetical protein
VIVVAATEDGGVADPPSESHGFVLPMGLMDKTSNTIAEARILLWD